MVKYFKGQGPESTQWFLVFFRFPVEARRGYLPRGVPADYLLALQLGTVESGCSCLPPVHAVLANSTKSHFEELLCPLPSSHNTTGLTSPHPGAIMQNVPFPGHRDRYQSGQKNQRWVK